jgi:predicted dienelactone hydrolase
LLDICRRDSGRSTNDHMSLDGTVRINQFPPAQTPGFWSTPVALNACSDFDLPRGPTRHDIRRYGLCTPTGSGHSLTYRCIDRRTIGGRIAGACIPVTQPLATVFILIILIGSMASVASAAAAVETKPTAALAYAGPGPYAVGQRSLTVPRADGTSFTALLFYPATIVGTNAPIQASEAPYPMVVFGHGFQIRPRQYLSSLQGMASWGFIVCAPESGLELFPDHAEFARDFGRCADELARQSETAGSDWLGLIDAQRYGIVGHSMGAGCSLLAAADESRPSLEPTAASGPQAPRLKVVIPWAAAETRPSAQAAAALIAVPQVYISGSADTIVPFETGTKPIYDAASIPKASFLLTGGSHCGFLDRRLPFVCDTATLPTAQQLALTRHITTTALLLHLANRINADSDAVRSPQLATSVAAAATTPPVSVSLPRWQQLWGPEATTLPNTTTSFATGFSWTPTAWSSTSAAGAVELSGTVVWSGPGWTSATALLEGISGPVTISWEDFPAGTTPILNAGQSYKLTVKAVLASPPTARRQQGVLSIGRTADDPARGWVPFTLTRRGR